jgi:hypothetical protein
MILTIHYTNPLTAAKFILKTCLLKLFSLYLEPFWVCSSSKLLKLKRIIILLKRFSGTTKNTESYVVFKSIEKLQKSLKKVHQKVTFKKVKETGVP